MKLTQVICPTGAVRKLVSSLNVHPLSKKYFAFAVGQIKTTTRSVPPHTEGRLAIVTKRGAGRSGRKLRFRRWRYFADGEVVWSWRPDAGVKPARGNFRRRRWQESPVTGESAL